MMAGKLAAALAYSREEVAPKLLAKGRGRAAEEIIAIAREAGVEVLEEPALAALLESGVQPGDYIPPWCWEAVARVLAVVFAEEQGLS